MWEKNVFSIKGKSKQTTETIRCYLFKFIWVIYNNLPDPRLRGHCRRGNRTNSRERMGRYVEKCYYFDMAWILHTWTFSNLVYQHKIRRSAQDQAHQNSNTDVAGPSRALPLTKKWSYKLLREEGSHSFGSVTTCSLFKSQWIAPTPMPMWAALIVHNGY